VDFLKKHKTVIWLKWDRQETIGVDCLIRQAVPSEETFMQLSDVQYFSIKPMEISIGENYNSTLTIFYGYATRF
jgi:hypothetical protein